MNRRSAEEFFSQFGHDEEELLRNTWESLDDAVPSASSVRLRSRFRSMLRREKLKRWHGAANWAGLSAMLVTGLVLGRLLTPASEVPAASVIDFRLLQSGTAAMRLETMISLRDHQSNLSPRAIRQLELILADRGASVGIQLVAVEALAAHGDQPVVQKLIIQLLADKPASPLVRLRLEEASLSAKTVEV